MKVSREVLNQSIYDMGYSKALEYWKLSDLQAENVLYNKKISTKTEEYKEKVVNVPAIDTAKADVIWKAIKDNYQQLKKEYIWNKDKAVINVRSESLEDKFHNALLRVVENLKGFTYRSDATTLEYVRSRLFFQKKTDKTEENRLNKKIILVYDSETTINNIPTDESN